MSTLEQKNSEEKVDSLNTGDAQNRRKQNVRSNSFSSSPSINTKLNANVQNSFSADSPYFSSYVENEMNSMHVMYQTLNDIAARTKTFGKCGALMAESTRRLALACRLRQPRSEEDGESEEAERREEIEVAERRRAVGEDMASLLGVMSDVSGKNNRKLNYVMILCSSYPLFNVPYFWKLTSVARGSCRSTNSNE